MDPVARARRGPGGDELRGEHRERRARSRPIEAGGIIPPAEQAAKLPSLPLPAEAFPADALSVDEWGAVTPVAVTDDSAAYDDPSPWGQLAREAVAGQPTTTRLSPALRCAAAEVTRFYVEKGAFPTETLRHFLVARCGGSAPDTMALVLGFDAPAPRRTRRFTITSTRR